MRIDISQISFIHETIKLFLLVIQDRLGVEPVITSLHRIGDKGIHGTLPLRAVDIRAVSPEIAEIIVDYINGLFVYDPARPNMQCAIYHDSGQGRHIHLQAHPSTTYRQPKGA